MLQPPQGPPFSHLAVINSFNFLQNTAKTGTKLLKPAESNKTVIIPDVAELSFPLPGTRNKVMHCGDNHQDSL